LAHPVQAMMKCTITVMTPELEVLRETTVTGLALLVSPTDWVIPLGAVCCSDNE